MKSPNVVAARGAYRRFARWVLSALTLSTAGLQAYEDRLGEVAPAIVVENGEYWVLFEDLRSPGGRFRRRYDANGDLLTPSRELMSSEEWERLRLRDDQALDDRPAVADTDRTSRYVLKRTDRNENGDIFGFLEGGRDLPVNRVDLQWGPHRTRWPHDFVVIDDSVYVLAAGGWLADHSLTFELFGFELETGRMTSSQHIGLVGHAVGFPGASRILLHRGAAHFAWVESGPGGASPCLVHSTFRPGSRILSSEFLGISVSKDKSMVVGNLDDMMCIAYRGAHPEISVTFAKLTD